MNKYIQSINEDERNIDWEEVEKKVSIICRKFSNIDPRYIDDLAQELRIHAYYVSDDYYDLQRKAIDFWRSMQVRVYPEVPFFDMELVGGAKMDDTSRYDYDVLVNLIKKELQRKNGSYYENALDDIALRILDIIVMDIDEREVGRRKNLKGTSKPYINQRISCTYLSEELPDIHYKRIQKALNLLADIIQGLSEMGKLSIDDFYKESFPKKEQG